VCVLSFKFQITPIHPPPSRRLSVPNIENVILIAPFTMDEVRKAVFQMDRNKAPGPDGFPAKFYQTFLKVIKDDLLALFADFHNDTLPVYSLNLGLLIFYLRNVMPQKSRSIDLFAYLTLVLKLLLKS
jgi:hypothetical protein